ncbi:MAG TPA: HlyD family efflux transporter periplasmic adaptor subunit [Gemmataceae bacterium]|jgi:WD40 repeat protein|nr:HlyD family efflux transporter periplasmic adaptor subunit [Gemmataceae bacterium]
MYRRLALSAALGGALLCTIACNARSQGGSKGSTADGAAEAGAAAEAQDIGERLYSGPASPTGEKPAPADPRSVAADPIVIRDCRLAVIEKRDVPAQRDGVLFSLFVHEGDVVKADQLLGVVDNRLAKKDLAIQENKVEASIADNAAAKATRDEAWYRLQRQLKLERQTAAVEEDVDAARALYYRYRSEAISKTEAIKLARSEHDKAQTVLGMYEIRSPIDGVIKAVYKKPGEAVKSAPSYEPVFQIYNLSRLRAEGLLDVHYLPRLRQGVPHVVIEPTEPEAPQQTLTGHLQEVTAVAVSRAPAGQKATPFVVSASTDGTVRVWDRTTGYDVRVLRHPGAVRAVACTGPRADGNWCLSGADDGVARLWDLDSVGAQPVREFKGGHRRAVTCVAFSPDGRFCATGGDSHEICLWETASGDLVYRFPQAHRAGVTSLQFLPRSQLVSAGRDNTLRLWTLGRQGARLETTLDRRSGDVAQPGASPDGTRVLFDQGKALRLLSLPGGSIRGVLNNSSGATNFTTFALFSPDARLIVTAGASEGRLQLWRAPTAAARGSELRQLVAPDRSSATCAAFAPDGSFMVAGTRDRHVFVWPVPSGDEINRRLTAKLTLLEGSVESSARQVRVWAELDNPDGRLIPGATATMVIETTSGE